nr:synaptobrevin, longin-like domain protein [Tanacetum cinerariifolium]
IETTEEGTKILATVDGKLKTVYESSIRRNLKLNDEANISSLPDAELLENLQLMGYNILPNQKEQFFHQWKYLIHTIMQCLSPKSTGFNEFNSNIAIALVCLATNRVYNFSKMIFNGMVKNVNNKGEGSRTPTESHHTPTSDASQSSQHELSSPSLPSVPTESLPTVIPPDNPPLRKYTRRTRIAQSPVLPHVADEPASPLGDGSQGEACSTDFGFVADQDRANIAKTSTLPIDSAPRVTSLAADKGSMQQKLDELRALYTSLQRQHSEIVSKFEAQDLEINSLKARIKLLEDKDRGVADQSGDDAPIKGKRLDKGEEAAKRVSNDTEEMINVLTSMDATTSLSSGVAVVPTCSGSIPTAGPPATGVPTGSDVVPTAGLIFAIATVVTPYIRKKGKEKMIESKTPKKKKIQEQMDIQMARQLEEVMERDAQRMNEQIARDAEISRIHAKEELQMMINSLDMSNETPRSKKQKKDYYMAVIKGHASWKTKDFKGMSFKQIEAKFNTVWKQIEDFIPMGSKEETKRFKRKGLRLEQVSEKKLKTSKEVLEEVKATKEVPEDKVKEIMQLVPVEEVYVEALQVKHPIIDWKVDIEGHRMKETLSIRPPTSDNKMELWVKLKRLYEPDDEDQLRTHTQNLMHALVEWKLYDTCGVHHVTSKDKEIFMLVEKDYPLRKGLAIVMIYYKLQVENYSDEKLSNSEDIQDCKLSESER